MKKRIISLVACGTMAAAATLGCVGCGNDNKLVLWGSAEQQPMLREMVDAFLAANPDFELEIELGVVSEAEAAANLKTDVKAGADVFPFANDQLMTLYSVGALGKLGTAATEKIKADNNAGSVEAARIDDSYYAYPYAADNGFFMYYDSSVVSEDHIHSLDDILADCAKAGKYFIYDIDNSWYVGAFLYGAGGDYEVEYENGIVKKDELGNDVIKCNFNQKPAGSELTYGEIGGTALLNLNAHPAFINGDDNVIQTYLDEGGFGACISGTWNATRISNGLGEENYAATRCPDFTGGDGKTYHMVAFSGYKLYGVNSYSKHLTEAHRLAAFLSSEEMQAKRFDTFSTGPSNNNVAAGEKVQANIALAALAEQLQEGFYKPQGSLPDPYWTALDAFGTDIYGKKTTADNLLSKVQTLTNSLVTNQ